MGLPDGEFVHAFKNLDPKQVTVIGGKDASYNCIACAVGQPNTWIDVNKPPEGSGIKPPKGATSMTLDYVDEVMKFYGFKKSKVVGSEKGKIKVAIYGTRPVKRGETVMVYVRHAARSDDGGPWVSKIGEGLLISHTSVTILEDKYVGGKQISSHYGTVVAYYEKPLPKKKGDCD